MKKVQKSQKAKKTIFDALEQRIALMAIEEIAEELKDEKIPACIKKIKDGEIEPEALKLDQNNIVDFCLAIGASLNSSASASKIADEIAKTQLVFSIAERKNASIFYNTNTGIFQEIETRTLVLSIILPAIKAGAALSGKGAKISISRKAVEELSFFLENLEQMQKSLSELNANATKVAVKNGVVNLETSRLEKFTPSEIFTKKIPIAYYRRKQDSDLQDFLKIFGDKETQDMMQKISGLSLTGKPLNFITILFGTGANGKSSFFSLLRATGLDTEMANASFFSTGASFEDKTFLTARAGLIEEIPTDALSESSVKTAIDSSVVTSRRLYENAATLPVRATLIGTTNSLPTLESPSFGLQRRLLVVPMARTFDARNINKSEQISPAKSVFSDVGKNKSLMEAFLIWRIQGAKIALEEMKTSGSIIPSQSSVSATKAWLDSEKSIDALESFFEEMVEVVESKKEVNEHASFLTSLFAAYKSYASTLGEKPKTLKVFKQKIESLGFEIVTRAPRKDTELYGTGTPKARKVFGIKILEVESETDRKKRELEEMMMPSKRKAQAPAYDNPYAIERMSRGLSYADEEAEEDIFGY